jgi:NADPH:quinone reductase-like Zn-dependent oxidoreductase
MQALLHDQRANSLSIGTTPVPQVSATQYLIKSHAVALTSGELDWPRPEQLNVSSPGVEFAGKVVQSPSVLSKFQPGDEIYARVQYPQAGGAREYTVSDDSEMALRPKNFSAIEAATIPVSALTAWQALFEKFELTPPSTATANASAQQPRILITNAAGGVGIWAVQLAKLANLHVVGTASAKNTEFIRSLGADEVLDYRTTDLQAWISKSPATRKVDFVLDCAGGASRAQAWHAVKPGGQLLTIVPPDDMVWRWDLETPEGIDQSIKGRFFIMHVSHSTKAQAMARSSAAIYIPSSCWRIHRLHWSTF